jgi:hypothetical protein
VPRLGQSIAGSPAKVQNLRPLVQLSLLEDVNTGDKRILLLSCLLCRYEWL